MANNRELSQLASLIVVDDTTRNIGIATTGFSKVGIGTTNPRVVLDTILNQDASTTIQVQNDTDGTSANASVLARNNLGFFSFQLNSSARTATRLGSSIGGFAEIYTSSTFAGSGIKIGTTNALPVIIGTNNNEALRIDSSQRVGIGTTNPLFNLHVGNTLSGLYTGTTSKSYGIPEGTQFVIQDTGNNQIDNKFVGMGFAIQGPGGAIRSAYFGGITDASGQGLDLVIGRKLSNTTYDESIRIDGSGNVGIGTTNPTYKLDVSGSIRAASTGSFIVLPAGLSGNWTGSGFALQSENSSAPIGFLQGASERVRIDASGNVGIGTTNPTSKLHVIGDVLVTGITTSTDFNSSSDINLKDNIERIQNPIDKLQQLDGVTFNWKETHRASVGVIAQQVEKVLPQLVSGDETKTVNYNGLIALLIECVKEQQIEINNLKEKLK